MNTPTTDRDAESEPATDDRSDDVVTITRAEFEALQRSATIAAGRGPASAPPDVEAVGRREEELTRELEARDRKVSDLEAAYRSSIRDRELATALAGRPLVAGAASQLIKLWRDDLDVYEESGDYRVAARDGRTVALWVADRLVGQEYAHFCLPTSRGGAGAKGLSQSNASDGATPAARTLGEAVVSQWRESAAARGGAPSGPAVWGRRR